MTARQFQAWRKRRQLSLTAAAAALGLSRRQIAYFDAGDKPIPKVVALACAAIDAGLGDDA